MSYLMKLYRNYVVTMDKNSCIIGTLGLQKIDGVAVKSISLNKFGKKCIEASQICTLFEKSDECHE